MTAKVVFHPQAKADLLDIYRYIRDRSGPRIAKAYTDRIRDYCQGFETFPERGIRRPDLGANVRVVGFERRVSIAFLVENQDVVILGFYYAGRAVRPFGQA